MAPVGFSDLPTEALDEIARRIGPFDNVTCSAVCRSWRRALKTTRLRLLEHPNQPHCVYLSEDKKGSSLIDLYPSPIRGPTRRKYIHLPLENNDDKGARPWRVVGCSFGWIVAADEGSGLWLLDPLTGRLLPLPPITSLSCSTKKQELRKNLDRFGRYMIKKAVLVPGSRTGSYAVFAMHSGGYGLLFLAPGAGFWKVLRAPWKSGKYMDAVFHRGALYTLSCDSEMNAWEVDRTGSVGLRPRRVVDPGTELEWPLLVESPSGDDLLMVSNHRVFRFGVRERRWLPVKNLGEAVILMGRSNSLCFSTEGFHDQRDNNYRYERIAGHHTESWYLPYFAPEFHHY